MNGKECKSKIKKNTPATDAAHSPAGMPVIRPDRRRILVFSVDAMVAEDMAYLSTLPNFRRYIAGGSAVERVRTIYPSVTYPAHVSMASGCWPEKHGLSSNFAFTTDSKEDTWHWFADDIRVGDIFTAAKRGGYSTAAVFWPVTGNHPSIDYNIDEYWMPRADDTLASSFARVGASAEVIEIIEANAHRLAPSYLKTGRKNFCVHPEVDDFLVGCAVDIIHRFAPEVTFVHNGNIDNARHTRGAFSPALKHELDLVDGWLGDLCRALDDVGVLGLTDIFLVSDHGQTNIVRTVKPNVCLARGGYIDLDERGKVKAWRAYAHSNAMSSNVYLSDPGDASLESEVGEYLNRLCTEGIYGFSRVLTRAEAKAEYHLDGGFSFVLESDGYTSFSDSPRPPMVAPLDLTDFRFGRATHGYMPEKGPQPVFYARGPHIREGVRIETRPIIDEAPTYAALLGVDLPDADGEAIGEILK